MSEDGIIEKSNQDTNFDDLIKVGEVSLRSIPERESPKHRRWVGINEGQDNTDVYFNNQALSDLTSDLQIRGSSDEAAGVLFGEHYKDRDTKKQGVKVSGYIPFPDHLVRSDRTSVTITPDAWSYALKEVEKSGSDLTIVGWGHSHPGYGIFLSSDDDVVNSVCPTNIAVVFDPTLRENRFGIFSQGGSVQPSEVNGRKVEFGSNFRLHHGFYLFDQGNERVNHGRETSGNTLENLVSIGRSEDIPLNERVLVGKPEELSLEEKINVGPSIIEVQKSDIYGTGILAKVKMVMEKLKDRIQKLFR